MTSSPSDAQNQAVVAMVVAAVIMILVGFVSGISKPDSKLSILFPLGLTVWWIAGAYGRRIDRNGA